MRAHVNNCDGVIAWHALLSHLTQVVHKVVPLTTLTCAQAYHLASSDLVVIIMLGSHNSDRMC